MLVPERASAVEPPKDSEKLSPRNLPTPAFLIATWFGAGLLPAMPGTWGTLAALPFAWGIASAGGTWGLIAAAAAAFAAGVWASEAYIAERKISDPPAIVIDEVTAMWLILAPFPPDVVTYGAGFALFRFFDVLKPWPVSWLDREIKGGLGVMLDDLGAAVYAVSILFAVNIWILT